MTLLARRTAAAERLWLAHADRAGLAVDAKIRGVWRELLGILNDSHGPAVDYQRTMHALRQLPALITGTLTARLSKLYRDAHGMAARTVIKSLTVKGLTRVATAHRDRRLARGLDAVRRQPLAALESQAAAPHLSGAASLQLIEDEHGSDTQAILSAFRRLSNAAPSWGANFINLVDLRREAGLSRAAFDAALAELRASGTLTLSSAEGRHGISPAERAAGIPEGSSLLLYAAVVGGVDRLPVVEPIQPHDVSNLAGLEKPTDRAGWEAYAAAIIFPPPSEETVWRALAPLVQPADWQELGDHVRKLPHDVATILAQGAMLGRSQRDTATQLLPYLDGLRYRAQRAARTFGLHIAHTAQEEAYAGLGDDLVGYQVHAVVDEHTRPWHKQRDGTIYYVSPKSGAKGMLQCPHPPLEAHDVNERPAGAPRISWNCRCYLTPVLRGLE